MKEKSNLINFLALSIAAITAFANVGSCIQTNAAADRAESAEGKVVDMLKNQVVLSKLMLEGNDLGGKFNLQKDVESSTADVLALAIPDPVERDKWRKALEIKIKNAWKEREKK